MISGYSLWLLCSSDWISNTGFLIQFVHRGGWYVFFLSDWVKHAVFVSLGTGAYAFCLISVVLYVGQLLPVCYLNSLLQTGNRFSVETSGRLKAALSEMGSERDSASLTETEKSRALLEHFFQTKKGFTVYTKVKKTDRRRKHIM